MPRRSILSAAERESLLALPDTNDELIRHYTFSEADLSIIRQRRGPANRLGFAVQLSYLRFPGIILGVDEPPFPPLLKLIADQLKVGAESWDEYGQREQTRREHLIELQTVFGFQTFTMSHYRQAAHTLTELAMQTDKGVVLADALIDHLRRQSIILPALNAIERVCAEAITRANRRIYDALVDPLSDALRRRLDDLLKRRENGKATWLAWLRQSPAKPNSRHMLEHIGRLKTWQALELPSAIERLVHQNRLLKIAREGSDPFAAIEAVMSWDAFTESVTEAQRLAQPEDFDFLHRIGEHYATLRRYAPEFLDVLKLRAAPAAKDVLDAIEVLRGMNRDNARKVPADAPTDFIKPRWQKLVMTDTAQALIDQMAVILPHVKITELLLEVDQRTGFTRHFTHLKSGDLAKDRNLLLTTILADAINLGLTKMAESCPGTTYAKLAWLQAWHIRDETYSTALAELVNAQFRHPFAAHWGDGTTSSSDGQNFRTGGKAESTGHINPKYGSSPGRTFYTHISDQYAPFNTKVVNVGVRDSTYVLDGLLYHESDLRIEEHYTDTAGFTDHVFGLMHLLGFRFAPRIRDLGDTKLYMPKGDSAYDALKPMIGGTLNIKQGTVTASLMLRKLGSYPRQNGLAVALRELGRIERTLFILDWLQSVELRRRVHAGLNKGEARNALARAVFFNRLGEIRDRSFEQQRYRASGLNLVTAAIVLWNTVYLERAANALRGHGHAVDDALLQ